MDARGWANLLRTEGDCEHERKMFINVADAIDALLAENAKLKDFMKNFQSVFARDGCEIHPNSIVGKRIRSELAALLNEKGE